jgi:hypothetical protein
MSSWTQASRFVVSTILALTVDNLTGGRTGVYGDGAWGVIPQAEYINSGVWLIPPAFGVAGGAANAAKAVQGAQTAGRWIQRSEYMSDAARAYQRFISGRADGLVYEIGGCFLQGKTSPI